MAKETILPAGDLRGRLRVAVPLSFGPTHFAPVLAEMARRHPQLHIHTSYSDRFVDLIAEGFDCAIRVGYLQDSNLIARRVGPINGKLVASPDYIEAHGSPETPEELVTHEALMQGTETWQFMDGNKIVTVQPQGVSRPTTAPLWSPRRQQDSALLSSPIASPMNMWPPARSSRHDTLSATSGGCICRPPAGSASHTEDTVLTEMLIEYCEPAPREK